MSLDRFALAVALLLIGAFAVFASGCNTAAVTVDGGDAATAGSDGGDAAAAAPLCTTNACAANPCADGCVFVEQQNGACGGAQPAPVDKSAVYGCPRLCGFADAREGCVYGCLRPRLSDPACQGGCGFAWGNGACFDSGPSIDYSKSATICAMGFSCFIGCPADAAPVCHDLGGTDGL